MPDDFLADSSMSSNGSYSIDKFYTAARDKKGFSTTVQIHIPPAVMNEIAALVATGRIPEYRTSRDVLRDCFIHGLHLRLEQIKDDRFTEVVSMFTRLAEAERLIEEGKLAQRFIDTIQQLVQDTRRGNSRSRIRLKTYLLDIASILSNYDIATEAARGARLLD